MKRETKVISGASLGAVALLLIPLLFSESRNRSDAELMARKPTGATLAFRKAVREATQIRVFVGVVEAGTPGNRIPTTVEPNFVLVGKDVDHLVQALHFQMTSGSLLLMLPALYKDVQHWNSAPATKS